VKEVKIGERVGKGNFGEVFKGHWRGVTIAIKKVPSHNISEAFLRDFHREIALMQ
jgi:hypothetical protein